MQPGPYSAKYKTNEERNKWGAIANEPAEQRRSAGEVAENSATRSAVPLRT